MRARPLEECERYCCFERKGLRRHVKAVRTRKYTTATPLVAAIHRDIESPVISTVIALAGGSEPISKPRGKLRAAPSFRKRTRGISRDMKIAHLQADIPQFPMPLLVVDVHAASASRCLLNPPFAASNN